MLERATAAGVERIIVPGVEPAQWPDLLAWAAREPRVAVGLGIHPQALPDLPAHQDDRHLSDLDALLSRGGACAVGECGLDGPTAARVPLERQQAVLRAHLALARKHQLPVIVHCLRAQPALLALLQSEPPLPAGVVLHSFSGSTDLVPRYARLGCHFSFAGPVTFTEARRPLDALRAVPLERLLAETDAPDQAPHPHRGERNEPAWLALVVEAMARARGEPPHAVRAAVTTNARRVFRLGAAIG